MSDNRVISIVDDEVDITTLFHEAICKIERISVKTFNDPLEALEHFTTNPEPYVLVLSDNKMPELNGLDLLRRVKILKPYVRTVLMSAFDLEDDDVLEKYLEDGIVNKFIRKPIRISALCDEVNNQLHHYELLQTGNKNK